MQVRFSGNQGICVKMGQNQRLSQKGQYGFVDFSGKQELASADSAACNFCLQPRGKLLGLPYRQAAA